MFQIEIGDILPKQICSDCFITLQLVFIFKQKCEKSKSTLETLIDQKVRLKKLAKQKEDLEKEDALEESTTPEVEDENIRIMLQRRLHKCELCDDSFSNPWSLGNHVKRYHADITPGEKCDKCDKTFYHPLHLKYHYEKRHIIGKSKQLCHLCGFDFPVGLQFQNHINVHHGVRPYGCTECNKKFVTKQNLKNHREAIHLKIKRFGCTECSFAFNQKSSLKTHIRSVHRKEKPYKCKICNSAFSCKVSLRRHIINGH